MDILTPKDEIDRFCQKNKLSPKTMNVKRAAWEHGFTGEIEVYCEEPFFLIIPFTWNPKEGFQYSSTDKWVKKEITNEESGE